MIDDFEQLYILAQNLEGTYLCIAKVRLDLLDQKMFEQWIELARASGTLNSAIERLGEMLSQDPS